jgi:anaerobic magnesium-protoporphyrin IX monomethyl ester cyclase
VDGLRIARESGMTVLSYYMFGFLDETPEDARMTIEFAKKLKTDYPVFIILIPYPGTAIYNEGIKRGIITSDHWREFTRNPVPDYRIPNLIENIMDRETMRELRNTGTRELYFRPRRIFKELCNISSTKDFSQKIKLGLILASEVYKRRSSYSEASSAMYR